MADDFQVARLLALRAFDVRLANGTTERVYAHMHDSGQNPHGHLSFITIDRDGHHRINRTFNTRTWDHMTEIASEITAPLPDVDDDSGGGENDGDPEPVVPRKRSREIH